MQRESIGRAVVTFFKVLLGDIIIIPIAMFWLMGDSADYQHDYSPESLKAAMTLLVYAVAVLGVGLHGQFTQQRTVRLIAILLGLFPVVWLVLGLIWHTKTISF